MDFDFETVVRAKLKYDQEFLEMCILRLYLHQETDEQHSRSTQYKNDVGFNKADGRILSGYGEILISPGHLSSQQIEDAGQRMQKYSKQLLHYLSADEIE